MATRRRLMLVPVYAAFLQAILMIWEWWWCWMVMIVTMAMMLLLWLSSQRAESVFLYLSNNSSNVLKLCSVWYQQLVGAVLPPSLMVLWHCTIALCSYPHVKVSIIDLSQIFTTAPIFEQSHYFRQNIWVDIWVQFQFQYIFQDDLPLNGAIKNPRPSSKYFFWWKLWWKYLGNICTKKGCPGTNLVF